MGGLNWKCKGNSSDDYLKFREVKQKKLNVIKRAVLIIVAVKLLPESKYLEYSRYFKNLDENADGYIDKEEA